MKLQHKFSRTELLIGNDGLKRLEKSKITVFGIGGVGSFAVEALARGGIGNLVLVDDDDISVTNLNRQIHALNSTISKSKVEIMKNRILDINPQCNVKIYKIFVKDENIDEIIDIDTDYVIDAIDTVSSKIALVFWCKKHNIKILSCMGTGNKFDPTKFKIADIYDTKICPLAKVMRYELRRKGIDSLKVLYSEEIPVKPKIDKAITCKEDSSTNENDDSKKCDFKKQIPGSISFVPPVAGMIIAGEVIKDILDIN